MKQASVISNSSDCEISLVKAAAKGDVVEIRRLLLNCGMTAKNKALVRASASGQAEVVSLLCAHGANVNTENGKALLLAIEEAKCAVTVAQLIRLGANIRLQNDAPLRVAVVHGLRDIAELLVGNGADVEAVGSEIRTWLHTYGDPDVIALLEPRPVFERESATSVRCQVSYPESNVSLTKIFDFRSQQAVVVANGTVLAVTPFDALGKLAVLEARSAYKKLAGRNSDKGPAPQ